MRKNITGFIFLFITAIALFPQQGSRHLFRLELYGGFLWTNPKDLNLIVNSEEGLNYFDFNRYYEYLQDIRYIESFSMQTGDVFKKIKLSFPFGVRVKVNFSPAFSLSLGFKYFYKNQDFSIKKEFRVIENSGNTTLDVLEYSPFRLNVSGYSISAGVHVGKDLGKTFRVEGYLTGGPVWAKCGFSFSQIRRQHFGDSGVERIDEYGLELKGEGKRFAVEVGTQIIFKISRRFHFFVTAGYAIQVIKDLFGPGKQDMYGFTETWQGRWGIKEATYRAPWGTHRDVWPSNYWGGGEEVLKIRDMELNLNAYQVNLGIAINF